MWQICRGAIFHGSAAAGREAALGANLRAFAPAIIWAATVWIAGGLQSTTSLPSVPGLDKVAHFGMYGVLGFLLARGWLAADWRGTWLLPVLIALLLGMADELRQRSVPGRSAEVADWVADVAGAATGVFIAMRLARRGRIEDSA
ncbi:MAG: VanZ family protein [Gemmatimonadetes bacterium]|nr:VanZ family protein [Gemmatimonadota bacterium]